MDTASINSIAGILVFFFPIIPAPFLKVCPNFYFLLLRFCEAKRRGLSFPNAGYDTALCHILPAENHNLSSGLPKEDFDPPLAGYLRHAGPDF
jgi:hypothetical protein